MIDKKTDDDSLRYFMEYLSRRDYINIVNNNDTDIMADIDIEADRYGEHYYFELKRRRCYTYTYPTAILSKTKYDKLKAVEGKSYYIAMYYDYIVSFDIKNVAPEYGIYRHKKTTDFNNNKMITEECVEFNINTLYKYDEI